MDAQRKLIELAKERGGFATYSAMAERMGVTTATMSQWRSGTVPLAESRLEELCDFAGENAGFWDISIRAERAKSSSLRRQLEAFLKAGTVLVMGLAWCQTALGNTPNFPTNGSAAMYIMRSIARYARDVARHFGKLARRFGERHGPMPAL